MYEVNMKNKKYSMTYDELFEACEGLFHRVGSEDLTLHCCLFSQETKHYVFYSIALQRNTHIHLILAKEHNTVQARELRVVMLVFTYLKILDLDLLLIITRN